MKNFKTLDDLADLSGRRVLLRVDLNLPMQEDKVLDDTRIQRVLPTINYLKERGAKVILMAHRGRPKGEVVDELSLRPVAEFMGVGFSELPPGDELRSLIDGLEPGSVILLENLRFYPGEESNDASLAEAFAQIGDVYVNDAFSVSHRAHMSVEAIARKLPVYAGLLMDEELRSLQAAMDHPSRPLVAIIGGAKVSTKLHILENLTHKVDTLIIGGAMANTFLLAQGHPVGKSLVEPELAETALHILKNSSCEILLPHDFIVAEEIEANAETAVRTPGTLVENEMILDAGPETLEVLKEVLSTAKTIVLNGPLGVFETPPFDQGTVELYQTIGQLTEAGALQSVAGGGETVAAIKKAGVEDQISYISTAGGAFLEWLEGRTLPGVEALSC